MARLTNKTKGAAQDPELRGLIKNYEAAKTDYLEYVDEFAKTIDGYHEVLEGVNVAAKALRQFAVDNFGEYKGKSVGPLQVASTRKADPVAFRALVGDKIADEYVVKSESLTVRDLERAVERRAIDESVVEQVTTESPMIKGMPEIKIKTGL